MSWPPAQHKCTYHHCKPRVLTQPVRSSVGLWLCLLRLNIINEIIFPKSKNTHETTNLISSAAWNSSLNTDSQLSDSSSDFGSATCFYRNFNTDQNHMSVSGQWDKQTGDRRDWSSDRQIKQTDMDTTLEQQRERERESQTARQACTANGPPWSASTEAICS